MVNFWFAGWEPIAHIIVVGTLGHVSSMETRTKRFAAVVTSAPTVLAYDGRVIPSALHRERVTEDEVIAAVRKNGYGDLAQTAAVVMESNGQLVVLGPDRFGDGSALARLSHPPTEHGRQ